MKKSKTASRARKNAIEQLDYYLYSNKILPISLVQLEAIFNFLEAEGLICYTIEKPRRDLSRD